MVGQMMVEQMMVGQMIVRHFHIRSGNIVGKEKKKFGLIVTSLTDLSCLYICL